MMKRIVKGGLAALCVVLLVCLPQALSGRAADPFLFTVFDGTVSRNELARNVPEETMTFMQDGVYYIYFMHFSMLSKISQVYYNSRTQEILLYNSQTALVFDLANNQAYERKTSNFFPLPVIWRDGYAFLPLDVVAEVFSLTVSYIESGYSPAPLLRISSQEPAISDRSYVQQLSSFLNDLYSNSNTAATTSPSSPTTVAPPVTTTNPATVEPEPEPPKLVYLAIEGQMNEHTDTVLDALQSDTHHASAAFFVPADSILQNAAGLRRAYAEGHTIGLTLPAGIESAERAAALLDEGNNLLKSVILTKTRLLCIEGGADKLPQDVLETVISKGFRLWNSNILPDLSGAVAANEAMAVLRSRLNNMPGTLVVGLNSGEICAQLLPSLLDFVQEGNYSLLTITEWDRPINPAHEIR